MPIIRKLRIPKLGMAVEAVTLSQWLVEEGQIVQAGHPLYVAATDKIDQEITSPFSGTVRRIGRAEQTSCRHAHRGDHRVMTDNISAMDAAHLSDTVQIHQLLAAYARAVDTKDWELYRSLFTPDAEIDYSSAQSGMVGTRDEIADQLSTSLRPVPMMMHYVTNIEADIDGDTARVRAMFYNPLQVPGFDQISCCGGYYHHEMVRTAEGWRSRKLREETVWFANPPLLE